MGNRTAPDADTVQSKPMSKKAMKRAKMDPAVAAALDKKQATKREAKKAARAEVIAFLKSYADEGAKIAARKFFGAAFDGVAAPRVASNRASAGDILKSLFPEGIGSSRDENGLFLEHQLGRIEMRKLMVKAIKNAKTADERVWVMFDFDQKVYRFVAVGPDMPVDWTGYHPITVEGEEIA